MAAVPSLKYDNREGNREGLPSDRPLGEIEAREKQHEIHNTVTATWKGRIWDTFDLPKDQRILLFKVDGLLLTFAALGYFLKNLDQLNVTNAFLSGMKEDIHLFGNELITSNTMYTVGYVIGQVPSNLLLTRVSPRWVIPTLELGWGIATLASYRINDYRGLYAVRFFVGLFESGFYPGIQYLLGGWYTPRELGKRVAIFWLSGSLGGMFSGILQAAASRNLDGVHGLEGWRWMFIIDAIITIPIAIFGFVFLPGLPLQDKKSWWLSDEEYTLAQNRLKDIGRAGRTPWTKKKIVNLLSTWHIYVLPLLYVFWNNSYPQPVMGFYLKSFNAKPAPVPGRHYSVSQINQLPLPQSAIFVVIGFIFAWLSDGPFRGRRWPFIYAGCLLSLCIAIPLKVIPLYGNIDAHFALYWLNYLGMGAGGLIVTWVGEIASGDSEKRSILVALCNDLAFVVQAVGPLFYWKTTDMPAARKGWTAVVIYTCLLMFWTTLVLVLLEWDRRKAAAKAGDESPSQVARPSPTESKESLEGDKAV
ncbi:Pantothenate transporter FEN2 [Vanrija pseudolonga]|uniref:Pantothenate transporter FEN2 n=1 Tax=Vanrija pseudolonga TaxID=143232 RepID=A0AAF1BN50_9TREE|nr:Pantothenate transporter FEN2 [Vanrija pseudolonga]